MRKTFVFSGLAMAAAIVLVFASVTYVLFNIDAVLKDGIETTASRAYKTEVTVAEASMSLKTGEGSVVGIRVASPPGFTATEVLHIPLMILRVDADRPAARAIAVSEAIIERPRVVLEIKDGAVNLARLRDSANAWARRAADTEDSASKGQRLIVDKVILKDGLLVLKADFLDDVETEVPMPDGRVTDIGAETEGALPATVIAQVTDMLFTAAERASRRLDLKKIAESHGKAAPDFDIGTLMNR